MAPIWVQSLTSDPVSSRLISWHRDQYPLPWHRTKFHHVAWIPEEFDPKEAQLGQSPYEEYMAHFWRDRPLSKKPIPQQKPKHEKRRGGGGSSSTGGFSRSSATYKSPATAIAPVSAAQSPKSAAPAHKPTPIPVQNPKSGSASSKPKAVAGPALMPDKNSRIGNPASKPKQQQVPEYGSYAESAPPLSSVQHQRTASGTKGFQPHSEPDKLDRCNFKCRNALLGTFGAIALLGFLCLLIRCIVLRNRSNAEENKRKVKTRAGKSPDRRWWREEDKSPNVLEEGLELTTPQQHIATANPMDKARPTIQRQPTPMPRRRISSSVSYEEPPRNRLGLRNNSKLREHVHL